MVSVCGAGAGVGGVLCIGFGTTGKYSYSSSLSGTASSIVEGEACCGACWLVVTRKRVERRVTRDGARREIKQQTKTTAFMFSTHDAFRPVHQSTEVLC
jgi:hypothetical protein